MDTMTSLEAKYNAIQVTLEQNLKDLQAKNETIETLELRLEDTLSMNNIMKASVLELKGNLTQMESSKEQIVAGLKDSIQKLEEETRNLNETHQAELTELRNQMSEQKRGGDVGEDNETDEGMARRLVEQLLIDKAKLEAKIEQLQNQATNDSDEMLDNYSAIVEEVKKVMNVVYRNLQAEFEPHTDYEGEHIKETLMNTIRAVTLQYLERKVKTQSQENIDGKLEVNGPPTSNIGGNSEEIVDGTGAALDQLASEVKDQEEIPQQQQQQDITAVGRHGETQSSEALKTLAGANFTAVGAEELPAEAQQPEAQQPEPPVMEKKEPQTAGDAIQEAGLKEKGSRDSSLERSWRPQPPPPPLFDDEDEDDEWLH